jgi:hypothetical protein
MTYPSALRLVPLVLVILIAALPAGAGARTDRSFGDWTATFSGTFDYEWSELSQEPCASNGDGSVRATFSGRLGEFEISYVRTGAFRAFGLFNETRRVSGAATLTDNRTINPPDPEWPPGSQCGLTTIDKSGCGTRGYDPAFFTLDSTNSERRPALHMIMNLAGVTSAFYRAGDGDCYQPGSPDFGSFLGNKPYDDDTGDWEERLGYLVGPRLRVDTFERRQAFTVSAEDTHRSPEGPGTYTGRRSVTITFTPVPNRLRAEELAASPVTVGHRGGFRVRLFPPWATARSYTWEMKRSHASRWTTLGTTATPTLFRTFRLAGNFKIRAIANGASAGGPPRRVVTGAKPLEVSFPTWVEIVTDQEVQRFTQKTWELTKSLATPTSRREVGYWIVLDTCEGPDEGYRRTRMLLGPEAGPDEDASLSLGPRPADLPRDPPEVEGCAKYMVASFHTHTPTTYRLPLDARKPVGPSDTDDAFNRDQKVPGVVFDYIEDPPGSKSIPFGYPKDGRAKRYKSGLDRRPTPTT